MLIRWLETTCGMKPQRRSFWLGPILTAGCLFGGMDQSRYGSPCKSLERRFSCTTGLVSTHIANLRTQMKLWVAFWKLQRKSGWLFYCVSTQKAFQLCISDCHLMCTWQSGYIAILINPAVHTGHVMACVLLTLHACNVSKMPKVPKVYYYALSLFSPL